MSNADDPGARRTDLAAALALCCVYAALASGHYHSVDGMLAFAQARSILYDGSLRFGEPFVWGVPFETSKYGIGLSLAYLPGLLLASGWESEVYRPGGGPFEAGRLYGDPVYALGGAPVHALVTAAAAYLVARLCRELGLGRGAALWALVLYGVGSPALVYARGDFAQPLAGLCWVGALYAAVRFRRTRAGADLLACALALFWAVLVRPVEGALLLPAALWVCGGVSARAPALALGGGFAAAAAITLLVNRARYGALLVTGYEGEGFSWPPVGVAGLLVSPGRGLLWAFPALWLAPLGAAARWRAREGRCIAAALVGLPLALLLLTGSWHVWWGGVCWGPRLMLPALPLLAALAGSALAQLPSRRRRLAAGLALAAGLLFALPGVATDLLAGYGGAHASAEASFAWTAYPPLGAWRHLDRALALSASDLRSIDVLWLRAARQTGFASLLVPPLLLAAAAALAVCARRRRA